MAAQMGIEAKTINKVHVNVTIKSWVNYILIVFYFL